MNNISEHVTFVKFMDSIVNVNNAVNVFEKWIFDSN